MKILAIIPARGGSKGIPRKNIKLLCGKPLINYTIGAALQSSRISEIMVSTEDVEIAETARQTGANVPFMRPDDLSQDKSSTLDTVLHVLECYEQLDQYFDAVCLLQPTSPLRSTELIESCIQQFESTRADSLISVRSVPHELNPHWIFEPNENSFLGLATGEKQIITRRQELPPAYYRDGSVYLTKTSVLRERNSLYGDKIAYFVTDHLPYVNLDTMKDWKKAKKILCAE
jgi:CMP-N-acetylneuraminic acid synthetase